MRPIWILRPKNRRMSSVQFPTRVCRTSACRMQDRNSRWDRHEPAQRAPVRARSAGPFRRLSREPRLAQRGIFMMPRTM